MWRTATTLGRLCSLDPRPLSGKGLAGEIMQLGLGGRKTDKTGIGRRLSGGSEQSKKKLQSVKGEGEPTLAPDDEADSAGTMDFVSDQFSASKEWTRLLRTSSTLQSNDTPAAGLSSRCNSRSHFLVESPYSEPWCRTSVSDFGDK